MKHPKLDTPTEVKLFRALYILTEFCVRSGHLDKNPYSFAEVSRGCSIIAEVRGKKDKYAWNEPPLEDL